MKVVRNCGRFPCSLRQIDSCSCIPANIQALTKYHLSVDITQERIWQLFTEDYCAPRKIDNPPRDAIGLKPIAEALENNARFPPMRFEYHGDLEFGRFEDLALTLENGVDANKPHIISIPVRMTDGAWNGWHMLTVLGYDPENSPVSYLVYDSEIGACYVKSKLDITQLLLGKKGKSNTDCLVVFPK